MMGGFELGAFLKRKRAELAGRDTLRRVAGNSSWLLAEQAIRMALGLALGVWLARSLGAEAYGLYNYALAVTAVVASVVQLGLNPILVRELAGGTEEGDAWLGSAFTLKMAAAVVGWLACVGVAAAEGGPAAWLLPICAVGLFFQAWDGWDLWFQARGNVRRAAQARLAAAVAGAGLRVALLLAAAPLWTFVAAGVFELGLSAASIWWLARRTGARQSAWRAERTRMAALLKEGWPLAVTAAAIQVQAQGDQILMATLLGKEELGQYGVALRVVGVAAFLPSILQMAAAPEIARARHDDAALYRRRLHAFYRAMAVAFFAVALPLMVAGPAAVGFAFGDTYLVAAGLVPLLSVRLLFSNFGVARGVFLSLEGLLRLGLIGAVAGAVTSVVLNLWLLPRLGLTGAILASFASLFVSTFLLDAFHPRARKNLGLMLSALLRPWRGHGEKDGA